MFLTPSQRFINAAARAMLVRRAHAWRLLLLAAAGLVIVAAASAFGTVRDPAVAAFAAENDAAMVSMMKGMHVRTSGNVDRDFAVMMMAHHQGAIDMALAQLRHGKNERLKRLANEIVVEQRQEITVMQAVLDQELPMSGDLQRH